MKKCETEIWNQVNIHIQCIKWLGKCRPWKHCHTKLANNRIRAVPEIILGEATFFFRPLHPQDTQGVRAPRPPGHVSALIKPPHHGSNMPWPPGQVTPPPPTPRTHCQQNTLPPPDKKVFAAHPLRPSYFSSDSTSQCHIFSLIIHTNY